MYQGIQIQIQTVIPVFGFNTNKKYIQMSTNKRIGSTVPS